MYRLQRQESGVALLGHLWINLCLVHVAIAACPANWTEIDNACFTVFTQEEPFAHAHEARQACLEEGADMASLPTYSTLSGVYGHTLSLMPNVNDRPYYVYIGLTDIENEGTFTWLDNSTLLYTNFSDPEPDDAAQFNGEDCVAIYSADREYDGNVTTYWADVPCCFQEYAITGVACSKPNDQNVTANMSTDIIYQKCFGGCPMAAWRWGEKCYSLHQALSSFNSTYYARKHCLSQRADLVEINNSSVEVHAASILRTVNQTTRPSTLYIARNDITLEGTFVDLDENIATFNHWAMGEPQNATNETHCTSLTSANATWGAHTDQSWTNVPCCENLNISWALCQQPVKTDVVLQSDDGNVFAETCYLDIDECASDPCLNGGTCSDHVMAFNCTCVTGYTGDSCETQIDYCDSNPCQNSATCNTLLNAYACNCLPGYTGADCETLYDACISEPCQNNGTCLTGGADYNCSCSLGFTGTHCETNINDCQNLTCSNNGTCVDGAGLAHCDCEPAFYGVTCQTAVVCNPPLPPLANASVVVNEGNGYGESITYTCRAGHKFPDMQVNRTLTCTNAGVTPGTWDLPLTDNCEPHCDYIPYVANSDTSNMNTRVGSVINFTCSEGFQFPDNSTVLNITCLDNGNWSVDVENISQCEIVKCPELADYEHQDVDTYNNTYNTTVTFWCDVGYVLHDNTTARTIKCLADGDWTADLPECQPVRCPRLDPLPVNVLGNTTNNEYNTYARFDCAGANRMLDGATYRIIKCDATAEWSDNITDCTSSRCFPLPFVANATPSTTDAEFYTKTTLYCIKGHRFFPQEIDSKVMACANNGWWSPILSACEPIYCGPQPTALNTNPSTDSKLYATVVDFVCDTGYYYYPNMSSVVSIECLDTKNWNDTAIDDCWPVVCPDPYSIMNGSRIEPPNYNYSSMVHYECDDGFKFIDGRTKKNLVCTAQGMWNESDVSCRKDRCSPVPYTLHTMPDTTNTSWYTNVTYTCNRGYEWHKQYPNKTTHHITCQNDGFWNDTDIPECTIKECSHVPDMANATKNDTTRVYNTYIEYECDLGYKYPDNSTVGFRYCSHEALWEPEPFDSCEIVHCLDLEAVENATRDSNETYYDHVVTYECLPGYQYPDKSKVKSVLCTANETWTTFPEPCEVVFCPPLPYWTETEFNSTENEFHSVVSYWCKEGYSFEDSYTIKDRVVKKTSECMEQKFWDPAIDDCLALESIAASLRGKTYESPQGVSIGTVACSLISAVGVGVVLLDLNKIYQDLKMMKKNCEHLWKKQGSHIP